MNPVDELREQFNRLFTDNAAGSNIGPDLQARFKAQLESWLNKLNIVSREEFDAQTKVLAAAQQQLIMLEQQIEELKSQQENQ